ncbi:MAG: TAXI family TRAP transporter solute-binding subunit [Sphingobacteriales bacterium]|nr:TAXI family TRAP transporter solute-binding subunit [Sphingobacteriales bacterium]
MKQILSFILLAGLMPLISSGQEDPFTVKNDTVLTIVSGVETGSYFQIAQDLIKYSGCKLVIKPSQGAINNYALLINDPLVNIGMVQYDVLLKGKQHDYETKKQISENLQVLIPLGYEDIHLITRVNSNILSVKDLAGKKVSVGNPQTEGTSITTGLIRSVTSVPWEEVNMSFDSAFVALLNGKIDAMFFVGYAPVQKLKALLPTFNQLIKLVPIEEEALAQFHHKTVITAGTYPWLNEDVATYAVRAYLVANIKTDNQVNIAAYEKLLNAIKNNMDILVQNGHPAWKKVDLSFKDVKWPVHPAAKKVFKLK